MKHPNQNRYPSKPGQQGSKQGPYKKWNYGQQNNRQTRDSSVEIRSEWKVVESFTFQQLNKMSTDIEEAGDVVTCGTLEFYDKTFDKITTKTEVPLEKFNRQFNNVTTTNDPVIQEVAKSQGNVFATDSILAFLMTCTRSIYSWDIIIRRVGSKLFFDWRDSSQFELMTVNETAHEPPQETGDINSASNLMEEATEVNKNFSQQVLSTGDKIVFQKPNPFPSQSSDEIAPVGYRYRKWKIGENITLIARCELDAVTKTKDENTYILIRALNEFDPKVSGIDWRQKLDTQRGTVLATELKNNSFKLARWTAQAILGGADQIKLGYVSRINPRDNHSHVILGVHPYKPRDFAAQINLTEKNAWGILKLIIDHAMKLPEGKYILLRDPNKPIIRLYEVPEDAFDENAEEEQTNELANEDD